MLVPLSPAVATPPPDNPAFAAVLAKLAKDSVVARTTDSLHTDQLFPGYEGERETAASANAQEMAHQA